MELHYYVLSLLIILPIFVSKLLRRRNSSKLPPGPTKLPLIGNIHQLFGSSPHEALHNLAKKHGPLMHLKLGEISNIVISSPETVRQVLKAHDLDFAQRSPFLALKIISYVCTNIVFSPYGGYWKQLRKICNPKELTRFNETLAETLTEKDRIILKMKDENHSLKTQLVLSRMNTLFIKGSLTRGSLATKVFMTPGGVFCRFHCEEDVVGWFEKRGVKITGVTLNHNPNKQHSNPS